MSLPRSIALATIALLLAACAPAAPSDSNAPSGIEVDPAQIVVMGGARYRRVCPDHGSGEIRCMALARMDVAAQDASAGPIAGTITAFDIQSAYHIPTTLGRGATVGVIDWTDDPNVESDLAVYRSTFGLPVCSTANGCFRKVNQNGQAGPLPSPAKFAAPEISLDVEMISATCPNCNIILVEANSGSWSDLLPAIQSAVALGATTISMSFAGGEFAGEDAWSKTNLSYAGRVGLFAASGDGGYGVATPAAFSMVNAVGGTTLTATAAGGWQEAAWDSGGSGCSAYVPKPTWQWDSGCANRTVVDFAAVANNVATYDTFGAGGWTSVGGTSVSTPIVAGIYAVTGRSVLAGSFNYSRPWAFKDIASGSNGSCGNYLCNAVGGYDGPTGLGTPDGYRLAFYTNQSFRFETGTPLGTMSGPPADDLLIAPNNGDLVYVKKQATGSGHTEVHILSAASGYQQFSLHVATPLGPTGTNAEFLMDKNRDLYFIMKQGTGSGHTEVHVLTAASSYTAFRLHVATPLPLTDSTVQFGIDYNSGDLYEIQKQNTASLKTEVHVLSAASNYQQYSLHSTTGLPETDSSVTFDIGQYGDLIAIEHMGTNTGSVEVHIFKKSAGYQTTALDTGTLFNAAPGGSIYHLVEDSSSTRRLYGLQMQATGTNTTEVHLLGLN